MLVWSSILFILGLMAFLDSYYNYGGIFRSINSILFMLIALGLFARTACKVRAGRIEQYMRKLESLRQEMRQMQMARLKRNVTKT
jgi:hypothetical protein